MNCYPFKQSLILVLFLSVFSVSTVLGAEKTLLDWNKGAGPDWPGWTWSDDVYNGHPGWTLNPDGPLGGGEDFSIYWGPRCFEYYPDFQGEGEDPDDGDSRITVTSSAIVDPTNRAPSTGTGGSLKVYETGTEVPGVHGVGWWVWYDGKGLGDRENITDSTTDRMSFYLRLEGLDLLSEEGRHESLPNANFHIGTYLCFEEPGDGRPPCPHETGNQHYYHYLTLNPGAWIHVLLDQHPQHLRESFVAGNNPSFLSDEEHYFENLEQVYMVTSSKNANETAFYLDEVSFFSTLTDSAAPNQNENSVTSLWVGYWPEQGYWEIGFNDQSFETGEGANLNDNTQSTFEVRWSTQPITNENFGAANTITPLFYGGEERCGPGGAHLIRRPNSWKTIAWTRFRLPQGTEANHGRIYFAVKDVSVAGGHVGTVWPWNRPSGDGRDAASPYVKLIDYFIPPDPDAGDKEPPTAPAELKALMVYEDRIDLSWTGAEDNIAVVGYRVFRNGSEITTLSGTSYSDTGLAPETAYTYEVVAFDAAGNPGPASTALAVSTLATTTETLVFPAEADTYVAAVSKSGTNFGNQEKLVVRNATNGYHRRGLLRFDLSGIDPQKVVTARLRLYRMTSEGEAGTATLVVRNLSGDWEETAVTWSSAPQAGTDAGSAPLVPGGELQEIPLTETIKGMLPGKISFTLDLGEPLYPWAAFSSREGDIPPELIVVQEK
ncbi:MAG: DNRLRE domain-containing protein [Desulfobacterales bacterium]|nr:DNRLRE domain-containing protein [Desulfobacterales bacterium]